MVLIQLFLLLLSVGCAGNMMPITNGSQNDLPDSGLPLVVWGQHKGAVGEAMTSLQNLGFRIVERSRLQQVFNEQKITLTHSTDDDAQILQVGKILGAGSIVFVEVESSSGQMSSAFVNKYGGSSRSETVTNLSVSLRGVNVESGEVTWTGTAHYPKPINNPEAGVVYLTRSALARGLCPVGSWKNDSEGCDLAKSFGTGMIGYRVLGKETPEGRLMLINTVIPNSPADQAGLKVGDVLLSCNGRSGFQSPMQTYAACKTEAEQTVTLQVKRGDKLTTISATAVSRTQSEK